jgi:predicted secreted protein
MEKGDEGDWETVGESAERSRSPAPVMTEVVAAAEEPAATEAEEEAPSEAGLVDIASILGAPTVKLVRSSL